MPKNVELEKVTLRLRKGDKEFIDMLYPNGKHNKVIRAIVSNFVNEKREALNHIDGKHKLPEVNLEELTDDK